jgi:1-acyl-sn-glycerol-3-phosphate acyltransferase
VTSDNEQPTYRLARALLRPPLMVLTKRDWRGQEHIPATGGCVVVTNHVSHFDPLAFAHFINDSGRAPRFLGKSEVFETPVVGYVVRNAGQIPVYRESRDATNAFRDAVAAVEAGECVGIYPEATLTRDPGLWPMAGKTGAARVALTTGCPLIPAAQWGPQDVLAPYSKVPKLFPRKTMHIWAGPPVDLDDLRGQELTSAVLREATDRVMAAVTAILERIRGEAAPQRPFDPKDHDLPRIGNPKKQRRSGGAGRDGKVG